MRGLLATIGVALAVAVLPAAVQAAQAPVIESASVSDVTQTGANLEAKINPEGLPDGVYYQFQIVANTSEFLPEIACSEHKVYPIENDGCMSTPISAALPIQFLKSGTEGEPVYERFTVYEQPLTPGTTYHFRVLAAKALATAGTVTWEGPPLYGPEHTFTTHPAAAEPTIESESVSHVTKNAATLEAKLNPEGLPQGTYYQFQVVKNTSAYLPELVCAGEQKQLPFDCWGDKPTPGTLPVGFVHSGSDGFIEPGQESQSVSQSLVAAGITLLPETTYHYRVLVAVNTRFGEEGDYWVGPFIGGPDQTFTTPPADTAPVIESVSLSNLTPSDATLEAQIDTEGQSTIYQFKLRINLCPYSECIGYKDIPLPSGLLLGSFAGQTVNVDLNAVGVSLAPGVYGYALSATSAAGHVQTEWQTLVPPVLDPPSPAVSTPSGDGQPNASNSGDQPAGSGSSSSTLGVQSPVLQPKTTKLEALTSSQKLATALKACKRKPKKKQARCKRAKRRRSTPQ